MVIEWLLDALEAAFTFLVGLFPETDFNPVEALSGAFGVMGQLNYFLPIAELVSGVVAFLVLGVPFMLTSLGIWIAAFIRGGSARG